MKLVTHKNKSEGLTFQECELGKVYRLCDGDDDVLFMKVDSSVFSGGERRGYQNMINLSSGRMCMWGWTDDKHFHEVKGAFVENFFQ